MTTITHTHNTTGNICINITLRHTSINIVAMEKQYVAHILSVYV
jgi:hypothetical protein